MKIAKTFCEGLHLFELRLIRDERGWFTRLSCRDVLASLGLDHDFPQVNQSHCERRGVFRGLHYQIAPRAEAKIVRCVTGRVLDISVDVRRGSPTFMSWFAVELDGSSPTELYVGPGFAHGYLALTDGATVVYQSSQPYNPDLERRLHYRDPRVGIVLPESKIFVSDKDESTPFMSESFTGIEV